jgi:hypothetical protein
VPRCSPTVQAAPGALIETEFGVAMPYSCSLVGWCSQEVLQVCCLQPPPLYVATQDDANQPNARLPPRFSLRCTRTLVPLRESASVPPAPSPRKSQEMHASFVTHRDRHTNGMLLLQKRQQFLYCCTEHPPSELQATRQVLRLEAIHPPHGGLPHSGTRTGRSRCVSCVHPCTQTLRLGK